MKQKLKYLKFNSRIFEFEIRMLTFKELFMAL